MNWEYDSGEETRDRTPLIWAGIVLVVVLMLVGLWATTKGEVEEETRAHVAHILFKFNPLSDEERAQALAKANQVRQEILDGKKFSAAAAEYSEDEFTRDRNGDMGFIARGLLTKPVDTATWQIPLETVSEVVESNYGFHLVYVYERTLSRIDRYEQTIHDRVFGNAGNTETP